MPDHGHIRQSPSRREIFLIPAEIMFGKVRGHVRVSRPDIMKNARSFPRDMEPWASLIDWCAIWVDNALGREIRRQNVHQDREIFCLCK